MNQPREKREKNFFPKGRPGKQGRKGAGSRADRRRRLLDALTEDNTQYREPDDDRPQDDREAPLVFAAVRAADERKAADITAVRVSHLTYSTDFFVNMTGRSKAQINAIVRNIEDEVFAQCGRRPRRQGKALGGWVCL